MVELFYVDMSRYNTSWRHEIRNHHLNYCVQAWRSIRRLEISKHIHLNCCVKTWRSFRRLAITHLVDKTYCDKMLSEGFVIIIYVNKYAMTTYNKAPCQTWWKKTRRHIQITTKLVDINLCEKEWSVRRQEIRKHDHLNYRYKTGRGRLSVSVRIRAWLGRAGQGRAGQGRAGQLFDMID